MPTRSAVVNFSRPACHSPFGSAAVGASPLQRNPCPAALINQKQQARLRRHRNLCVISGRLQHLVPLEQRRMQLIRALNRRPQYGRAQPMHFAPGGIQHQQSLRGKSFRIEFRKRLAQCASRLVRSHQRIHRVSTRPAVPTPAPSAARSIHPEQRRPPAQDSPGVFA